MGPIEGQRWRPFPVDGNKSPQNKVSTYYYYQFHATYLSFPDGGDISKEMYGIETNHFLLRPS